MVSVRWTRTRCKSRQQQHRQWTVGRLCALRSIYVWLKPRPMPLQHGFGWQTTHATWCGDSLEWTHARTDGRRTKPGRWVRRLQCLRLARQRSAAVGRSTSDGVGLTRCSSERRPTRRRAAERAASDSATNQPSSVVSLTSCWLHSLPTAGRF